MKLYEELKWRGLIKDVSNEELAEHLLNNEKITFYCGFDPSAPSLTIGNFVQVIRMRLLQQHGHKPIILVGGATGLIGDPNEIGERNLLTIKEALYNAECLKKQFSNYLSFNGENKAILVNNYDWISELNVIGFLRDYGKNFSINYMLAKDSVATRLQTGISYTEFSYMIIQAIDFLHLYKNHDCIMQFGGSDQWGNITAGLELIRKVNKEDTKVIALSSPLLLKADGSKFGKSASGALWLDAKMTSPYAIYQYLINTGDAEVIDYLKFLTLLNKDQIDSLAEELKKAPEKRLPQKALGREVVTFLHGEKAYEQALKITEALFSGDIQSLSGNEIEQLVDNIPTSNIDKSINVVDLLVKTEIITSKREARELITNGAISINGQRLNELDVNIGLDDAIDKKYIVICKGKKNYFLVKLS